MNKPEAYAMVEILGAAHAVQVIDQMVKCATLEVCGWETSCGGHATVVLSGAVSACVAAVDSIRENPPCEVCGACVISGPSEELIRLVEQLKIKLK